MKRLTAVFLFIIVSLTFSGSVYASDYVLPYPSYMPGHRLYQISTWWDSMQQYWHFGHIAGIKYNRAMSDKYLVEAKVLFEHGQYKLAVDALQKSNEHFTNSVLFLIDIRNNEKDNGEQEAIIKKQAVKHIQQIEQLISKHPDSISWEGENLEPEDISLKMLFMESKEIRKYANR